MGWDDMNGWSWVWMTTMMVLFWGVVAVAVVMLLRRSATTGAVTPPSETPEDILHRRLAHGEIEVDEYGRRLEALKSRR